MKSFKKINHHFTKIVLVFFGAIIAGLVLIWLADYLYEKTPPPQIEYGVTFSYIAAQKLNLDPMAVYQNIVNDLKVKHLRIPIYWNTVESYPGQYNFALYDQLFNIARQRNIQIMPVVGYKVPRWPECFAPSYTDNFTTEQFKNQLLKTLEITINHFKNRSEIIAWQLENEPMLDFGVCRKLGSDFLKTEVNFVKSLDRRPIVITDSGERGYWISAMSLSDIMGTTLYRSVWDQNFGLLNYPIPSIFYPLRAYFTKMLFAPKSQGILISELQAEPWPADGQTILQIPIEKQKKLFNLAQFQDIVNFAAHTKIPTQYFWGVEWWYWMKTQGHPEYWQYAKSVISN